MTVARDAELWARQAGWPAAAEVLAHRRGHAYDPAVVDVARRRGRALAGRASATTRARRCSTPSPPRCSTIEREGLDGALAAVADFADLKSPFFLGHSPGVADLAAAAAARRRPARRRRRRARRAALVHDVGRVGVPSGIWDRPGR